MPAPRRVRLQARLRMALLAAHRAHRTPLLRALRAAARGVPVNPLPDQSGSKENVSAPNVSGGPLPDQSALDRDPLYVAINSARVCIERFRVRPQSTFLLSTALRELDDAANLRRRALDEGQA